MKKRRLKAGDIVKVTRYRPAKYAPGARDELRTEELFKNMVGKCYRVQGIDQYGHLELQPKRLETVWIEPDLVELSAPQAKVRNMTSRTKPHRPGSVSNRKRSARRG